MGLATHRFGTRDLGRCARRRIPFAGRPRLGWRPPERRQLPRHSGDLKYLGRERTGRVRVTKAVVLGAHGQVGAAAAVQDQDRGRERRTARSA